MKKMVTLPYEYHEVSADNPPVIVTVPYHIGDVYKGWTVKDNARVMEVVTKQGVTEYRKYAAL